MIVHLSKWHSSNPPTLFTKRRWGLTSSNLAISARKGWTKGRGLFRKGEFLTLTQNVYEKTMNLQ